MFKKTIQSNIRYRYLASTSPWLGLMLIMLVLLFWYFSNQIVSNLGKKIVFNQVQHDRFRITQSLIQDQALVESLVSSPTLIAWLANEQDVNAKRAALAELERVASLLSGKSFFVVPSPGHRFYYRDLTEPENDNLVKYTLKRTNPDDAWFFQTAQSSRACHLNVDRDRVVRIREVWTNCIVRDQDGQFLGMVGTGIGLQEFVSRVYTESDLPNVTSMFINRNGAIIAHPDIAKINQHSMSKPLEMQNSIFGLLEDQAHISKLLEALSNVRQETSLFETLQLELDGKEVLFGVMNVKELNGYSISLIDLEGLVFGHYLLPLALLLFMSFVATIGILSFYLNRLVISRVKELDAEVNEFRRSKELAEHVSKDSQEDEIGRLNHNFQVMAHEVQNHTSQLERTVEARTHELKMLASTDSLTGTYNRRRFFELAKLELVRAKRYGDSLSLMVLDLDHFKSINDTYGHGAGDMVLKEFVLICRGNLRENDIFGRTGGEEFAAMLPNTSIDSAFAVAERIRSTLEKSQFEYNDDIIRCTTSIGLCAFIESDKLVDDVMERADKALYQAKNAGRNQIKVFE